MKKYLLLFISLLSYSLVFSQEQIEKIFDPSEQDWEGRNLGQIGFSPISAVKVGNEYYFSAFNENSKVDIWKTDLNETELFLDLDENEQPFLHHTHGDWIIYTDQSELSGCKFKAVNVRSHQQISLFTSYTCSDNYFTYFTFTKDYLAGVQGKEIIYQNLSQLPNSTPIHLKVSEEGFVFLSNIDENRILLKDANQVFGNAPYYILDLPSGHIFQLEEILNKDFSQISQFVKYDGRYYFQITTKEYVEKLLVSIDTNFTESSTQIHGNFLGNLLHIANSKVYVSDFSKNEAYLGIYDIQNFKRIDSVFAKNNNNYSIWSTMTPVKEHQFIIYGSSESIYHYDSEANKLTYLTFDNNNEDYFIYPLMYLDSGVIIRFQNSHQDSRMLYYDYSNLQPKEILKDRSDISNHNRIVLPISDNKVLAVIYDEKLSSEYAVMDVKENNYKHLKDIHTQSLGKQSMVAFSYILPNHHLLIPVINESTTEAFILNPLTKEATKIRDASGHPILFSLNDYIYNLSLYQHPIYQGVTEFSHHGILATDDSNLYFMGKYDEKEESQLFKYNFITHQIIKSVSGIHFLDKIFRVGKEIYVFRKNDSNAFLKKREILHLQEDKLVSIYEANILDNCYDIEDINQYFIHDDILYFTSHGKLLSLNSRNNQIEVLVDELIQKSTGCYSNGVVFGNFLVKDNEVYFTESLSRMFYFYISFIGFIGEIEHNFWKTDGTASGTHKLDHQPLIDDFYNYCYLFMVDDEIYRSKFKSDVNNQNSHSQLYKWTNHQWDQLEVLVDDTLTTILPPLYYYNPAYLYAQPDDRQRTPAHWEDQTFFVYPSSLINDTTYQATIYSFKAGIAPTINTKKEILYEIVNTFNSSKQASPFTVLGDKIYFPSSNKYGSEYIYHPEILQYSMENNRTRNVIQQPKNFQSADNYIVKDEAYETGYFVVSDEKESYFTKVYRLNACPLLDEPVEITLLQDTICNNGKILVQLEGLSNPEWIFFKVNNIETPFTWTSTNTTKIFEIDLDLTVGNYQLSWFLDTGCGIDSIGSREVYISHQEIPTFSIWTTPQTIKTTVQYSCSDVTFDEYDWEVNPGTIISGQGTSSIIVDWETTENGTVQLRTKEDICYSDIVQVEYSLSTNINDQSLQEFLLYPNPATESITIELPQNWSKATYQLISIDGRLLETQILNSKTSLISLNKYSAGTYIIRLENGDKRTFKKLILHP